MTIEVMIEFDDNPFLIPLSEKSHEVEIRNIIRDMVEFTRSLTVDNESTYKKITSLYSQARKWKKAIEDKRKDMTEPLRKQAAAINDKAKELTDPLDNVIAMANNKANGYMKLLEEIKRKEDEKLKAAASLFDEEELYIPPMETVVRGEGAVAVTKTEKRFRVLDITKVPAKYLLVDEASIKKDLQLGVESIPGIEVWEETTTQLRVR